MTDGPDPCLSCLKPKLMTAMSTTPAGKFARSMQEIACLPPCVHMTPEDITGREARGLIMLEEERRVYQKDVERFERTTQESF